MVLTNSLFVMQKNTVYRAMILKLQRLALHARNDFTFGISLNKVTVELYQLVWSKNIEGGSFNGCRHYLCLLPCFHLKKRQVVQQIFCSKYRVIWLAQIQQFYNFKSKFTDNTTSTNFLQGSCQPVSMCTQPLIKWYIHQLHLDQIHRNVCDPYNLPIIYNLTEDRKKTTALRIHLKCSDHNAIRRLSDEKQLSL